MGSPSTASQLRRPAVCIGLSALSAATALQACHRREVAVPPPASMLKVEMGKQARLDPEAALRCFVHGQFVGMQTPAECAQKNGVAPGALDVGLDQSGALAAGGGDTPLQPLAAGLGDGSGADDQTVASTAPAAGAGEGDDGDRAADGQSGDCMRYGASGWSSAGHAVPLNACVRTLFEGRCAEPGQTVFGRWGGQTLRLTPGRIAISGDNRDFRPLAVQDPNDCSIPSL